MKLQNKFIIFIVLLISVLGVNRYINTRKEGNIVIQSDIETQKLNNKKIKTLKKKIRKNEFFDSLSLEEQLVVDTMKPIDIEELKDSWSFEYGCYQKNFSVEYVDAEPCDNMYLTAKSYDEALWMQRNGYPSSSSFKLMKNIENLKVIDKLARVEKYVPAMILLAINDLESDNVDDAFLMAMNIQAYSKPNLTFSHRIAGQAFIEKNNIEWGLKSLKIASLLGDYEAQYLFNRYITRYPTLVIDATDNAHYYLDSQYGVSSQYPVDLRPLHYNGG